MSYYLPRVRQELAKLAGQTLGVDNIVIENASDKFEADLAIPLFAFSSELKIPVDELAKKLAADINHSDIDKTEPVGGFVNIWLKPSSLAKNVQAASDSSYGRHDQLAEQEVVIEHTDANPFKELHIGHIYSNTVGESLARLYEVAGAKVHRVSYHGDVGLHIAKAVWALGEEFGWDISRIESSSDSISIGDYYAKGAKAYEDNDTRATQIREINVKIYEQSDKAINAVYEWGKQQSLAYFKNVYDSYQADLFDGQFFESQSGSKGVEVIKDNMGVFETSQGAVVFRDEDEHTRVFINSQGLPTYEAKELGLAFLKKAVYPNTSQYVIITANEIDAYFKVVLKALSKINPKLANETRHLSHGLVKLPQGKMSSRSGEVVLASELLSQVKQLVANKSDNPQAIDSNALAAIKYAFLKQNIGSDIIYDIKESVNLEGQTGPYIQYAGVRIQSILSKVSSNATADDYDWLKEKTLLLLISKYPEVVQTATDELAPHRIAHYVYDLAREFNRYYESVSIKDAPENVRAARLELLQACHNVLKSGLWLMNISIPENM